jgi:TolB-like protein
MRKLRGAVLLLALILVPMLAHGQDARVRVAILPFDAATVVPGEDAQALQMVLSGMIATELSQHAALSVVERTEVDALIESQQLALSGRPGSEVAVQVGQLLGALYVVTGSVVFAGRDARLDIRLVDVETGAVSNTYKERVGRDDFLDAVETLAARFTENLKVAPRAVAVADAPPAAKLAYSRGLDYERRGQGERAAVMYERVLELFPDHEGAKRALSRVR